MWFWFHPSKMKVTFGCWWFLQIGLAQSDIKLKFQQKIQSPFNLAAFLSRDLFVGGPVLSFVIYI
jgi:hypothetical protein